MTALLGNIWRHPYALVAFVATAWAVPGTIALNTWLSGGEPLSVLLGLRVHWYLAMLALLAAATALAFYAAFRYYQRLRYIHDTPTVSLATAAQGRAELVGTARRWGQEFTLSPYARKPCVWWRAARMQFADDDSHVAGLGSIHLEFLLMPWAWVVAWFAYKWNILAGHTSRDLFLVEDATGECAVDPTGAEVICRNRRSWFNSGCWHHEQYLLEGDNLYLYGELQTRHAAQDFDAEEAAAATLREWKRDPESLRERFDADRDGEVDAEEWEAAHRTALHRAAARRAELMASPGLHLIAAPHAGAAFIISALPEIELIRLYGRLAALSFLLCLMSGIGTIGLALARGLL